MTTARDLPPAERRLYIESLRAMTPQQRFDEAMNLSELSHEALRVGLRIRHPEASADQLNTLFLERLERCRRRTS